MAGFCATPLIINCQSIKRKEKKNGKKIGVLISGCGVFDGAEIHESVLTLLFIDRAGAEAICMAPDINQLQVINHLTSEETKEKRNVLVESARIARGEIRNLKDMCVADMDALIIPGGFGAAKNLRPVRLAVSLKRSGNERL